MYINKNYFKILERIELILSVSGRFRKVPREGRLPRSKRCGNPRSPRTLSVPPPRRPWHPTDSLNDGLLASSMPAIGFATEFVRERRNIRAAQSRRGSPRSTLKRQRHGSSSNLILAIDAPTSPATRQRRSWFLLQGNNRGEHDD